MTVNEDLALIRKIVRENKSTNEQLSQIISAFSRVDEALISGSSAIPDEWMEQTKHHTWLVADMVRTVRRYERSYLAGHGDRVYINEATRSLLLDALHFFAKGQDRAFYSSDKQYIQYGGIRIRTIKLIREIDPSCNLLEAKIVMQSIFNPIYRDNV